MYAVQSDSEELSEVDSRLDAYSDSSTETYGPEYPVPELEDSKQSEVLDDCTRDTRHTLLEAVRARRAKLATQRTHRDIQVAQIRRSFALKKYQAREDECMLLRRLNTHTLIARLPDEVLGLVFQAYADPLMPQNTTRHVVVQPFVRSDAIRPTENEEGEISQRLA